MTRKAKQSSTFSTSAYFVAEQLSMYIAWRLGDLWMGLSWVISSSGGGIYSQASNMMTSGIGP
jgi:hypothetical protein